ncbi:MAG: ribosomal protein L7/L12 [Desulfobacteraceae bacterium]|jgi:ribosomal protein L7/L12
MHRHGQLIFLFLFLAVVTADTAWSAELAFVSGTIVRPEGANEGDALTGGTVVETGPDGMAMVEYQWPSDKPGYNCIRIVIFGYGQSYTVSGEKTPGRCDTTVPANPDSLREGEAFLSKGTRYGDAKTDMLEAEVPIKVKNSQKQWKDFQQWTMKAERTFTGDVVSVGEGRIKLRSPFSHRPVYFSATPTTVDSPVPLDSLVDKRVYVYYKITAQGKKAVRIRLTQPIAVLHRPPFVTHNKPNAGITQPPSGVAEIDDHGKEKQTDTWFCKVDLHQGDTGKMKFTRHGDNIKGMMSITRRAQRHNISGTWKGDDIAFWRALSKNSGQKFKGTVSSSDRGEVQMTGRFAHNFRGVWSAECSLQHDKRVGDKGYNVVLTGVGNKKNELIRAFRAVTGLGFKASKEAIENAPYMVKKGVSIKEARRLEATLEKAGGRVTIEKQQ